MVEGPTENLEWEGYHPSTPGHGNQDRCLNHRMGSSVPGSQDRRTMVPLGARPSHQCIRTDSSPVSSADICKVWPQHTKTHPSKNGQCLSTDICLPDGRNSFPRPDESRLYTLGLVPVVGNHSVNIPLTRTRNNMIVDQESRKVQTSADWKLHKELFLKSQQVLGTLQGGSICQPTKPPATQVHQLEARSRSEEHRSMPFRAVGGI